MMKSKGKGQMKEHPSQARSMRFPLCRLVFVLAAARAVETDYAKAAREILDKSGIDREPRTLGVPDRAAGSTRFPTAHWSWCRTDRPSAPATIKCDRGLLCSRTADSD